jgi:hypothetical protein
MVALGELRQLEGELWAVPKPPAESSSRTQASSEGPEASLVR